jgi:hypothetical protein
VDAYEPSVDLNWAIPMARYAAFRPVGVDNAVISEVRD